MTANGITSSGITKMCDIISDVDFYLDTKVGEAYQLEPLAQDWARISKVAEELGEAIQAFIGVTGQNPRKGKHGDMDDVLEELADVVWTGLFAIQHFTKNRYQTISIVMDKGEYIRSRVR